MPKIDLTKELNEPQLKAARSIEGPVLIIAGAGSGKTRVITFRIAYMLERGIPQSSILALTFTNKAAREMQSRVKRVTGKKVQSLTVCTFHAFGLKIIKENAELLGYRKNFSVYDEQDKITLIKETFRECRMNSQKVNLYETSQYFSKIKTGLAKWTDDSTLENVYEEYNNSLKIYNAVDFDDLLCMPLSLLENNDEVKEKYRKRFRYIMVDEFQDTSLIQYKLMKILTDGENANCCVVGDDDQSIYSWRGANYKNILLFEKDFPSRTEIKLEQNYRSTSNILSAANSVISNNAGRKDKNLWSPRESGLPIEFFRPKDERAEGEFIASQIRNLMIKKNYQYHDFGILTRTNSLIRNLEESFLAENIPYRVSGGTSFFQRKEIKDINSYLRVIANPDDDISLLRIINTPRRGIGKTTIKTLNEIAKKNHFSIWNAIVQVNHAASHGQQGLFLGKTAENKNPSSDIEIFSSMIENFCLYFLDRQTEDGNVWKLSQCVRQMIEEINYWGYLLIEYGKDEKKAMWRYNNIHYYIKMIEYWESDPDNFESGLYAWLNRISLITQDDEDDAEGKVNISTIHAAKGLEFPVVFIVGAEKGLIPHEKSMDNNNEDEAIIEGEGSLEEERRLFYVAITRAKEKLYITCCNKRRRLTGIIDCEPSMFIKEIPEILLEYRQNESDIADDEEAEMYISQMKALFD